MFNSLLLPLIIYIEVFYEGISIFVCYSTKLSTKLKKTLFVKLQLLYI